MCNHRHGGHLPECPKNNSRIEKNKVVRVKQRKSVQVPLGLYVDVNATIPVWRTNLRNKIGAPLPYEVGIWRLTRLAAGIRHSRVDIHIQSRAPPANDTSLVDTKKLLEF